MTRALMVMIGSCSNLLGQAFSILRSFSHYSNKVLPNHVETIYIDDGPDAVDYKL